MKSVLAILITASASTACGEMILVDTLDRAASYALRANASGQWQITRVPLVEPTPGGPSPPVDPGGPPTPIGLRERAAGATRLIVDPNKEFNGSRVAVAYRAMAQRMDNFADLAQFTKTLTDTLAILLSADAIQLWKPLSLSAFRNDLPTGFDKVKYASVLNQIADGIIDGLGGAQELSEQRIDLLKLLEIILKIIDAISKFFPPPAPSPAPAAVNASPATTTEINLAPEVIRMFEGLQESIATLQQEMQSRRSPGRDIQPSTSGRVVLPTRVQTIRAITRRPNTSKPVRQTIESG
jgi:hypothetical protein